SLRRQWGCGSGVMWRVLPAGIVVSALLLAAASAPAARAEPLQERRANPAPQRSAYDWTGPYAGINVGAAFGSYHPTTTIIPNASYINHPRDVAAINAAGVQAIKPLGFLGGIQAGYNWQFGKLVLGLEADLDYLNLNGTANSGGVKLPGG